MKSNSLIYLLFLLLICSCEQDDDIPKTHPNLGEYNLISLKSNIALDLNYDGIQSTDFKQELSMYYEGRQKPKHDLQFVVST